MAGGGNGGGGRGSFLKKAARKIFVATYACRSSSRRKSRSVCSLPSFLFLTLLQLLEFMAEIVVFVIFFSSETPLFSCSPFSFSLF